MNLCPWYEEIVGGREKRRERDREEISYMDFGKNCKGKRIKQSDIRPW